MTEKVKSFSKFLNESSRMDLPSPDEVKGLSVFKEIESIFPGIGLYGGGKQPLEFTSPSTSYNIKYSRTGYIYYGGYSVGTFTNIDNNSLEFIKDYLISKATDLSISSLDSIIEGRTPISNKILKKDWEKYMGGKPIQIFKKGVMERIKDFSNTIKYYQNHPLDKSYNLIPELKKIVEDGFEKSPAKEVKEGDLTLEQKNYLKDRINRQTDRNSRRYIPENKGKPKYELDKKTGLVDVYGDFDSRSGNFIGGDLNFMGIKFGKIHGDFSANFIKSLPQKNLSGFPYWVDRDFRLIDNGFIKSLEGFPIHIGGSITIEETSVKDFSALEKIDLSGKNLDLSGNTELKNLSQVKLPNRLKELRISRTPLKSLEGCPDEVEKLTAHTVEIEDIKGCPKKAKEINIYSPNLKDISGISEIEGLISFSFRSTEKSHIQIYFPLKKYEIQPERITGVLNSEYFSQRDKEIFLGGIKDFSYNYFEENPLELYLLDSFPDIKKDVIQKRNIPDLGKLGNVLNKGFL